MVNLTVFKSELSSESHIFSCPIPIAQCPNSDLSGCFPLRRAHMVARQTSAVSCGAAGMCRLACAYPGDVRRNKNRSRSTKFKVECRRDGTPFYAARPQRHSKRQRSAVLPAGVPNASTNQYLLKNRPSGRFFVMSRRRLFPPSARGSRYRSRRSTSRSCCS